MVCSRLLVAYPAWIVARPRRRSGNLPSEATSFVGRRRELAEIRKKLTTARVVSLVGPGGVGKTRLAIRAADNLGRGFADGSWLVELADLHDAALVTNAVVAALDLRDQTATEPIQVLSAYLQDKQLLLVVDNCEHVLDAAAQLVAGILRTSPNVRVITTSREPLQISGEYVVPVPPLELPEANDGGPARGAAPERSGHALHGASRGGIGDVRADRPNQAAVVQLCRRLDGLPLGDRARCGENQSPDRRADRRPPERPIRTPDRRSDAKRYRVIKRCEATIDWSHDLLSSEEQTLLRRLCIFGGSFTAEDAGSVCSFDERFAAAVPDTLASLMDKSLVLREDFRQQCRLSTARDDARIRESQAARGQ